MAFYAFDNFSYDDQLSWERMKPFREGETLDLMPLFSIQKRPFPLEVRLSLENALIYACFHKVSTRGAVKKKSCKMDN
jgi:hypothetical protein